MSAPNIQEIRCYLEKAISSLNNNKLFGMKAEADFRRHACKLGISDRVSPGGWIFRRKGIADFGEDTIAVFPHIIELGRDYSGSPEKSQIPLSLHTICATMHQIGIRSYYAHPVRSPGTKISEIDWYFIQLGVPWTTDFIDMDTAFSGMKRRDRMYNYLRYQNDASSLGDDDAIVQFSHESVRIHVETVFMAETSDIDAIVWGERFTYPIEIKEKVAAKDNDLGEWFGIDVGPFVKLAHYATRKGNLHSLFIVREIADQDSRELIQWLFTDFDTLAHYASWVPRSGGQSMRGGRSMVVRVPRTAFRPLDAKAFSEL